MKFISCAAVALSLLLVTAIPARAVVSLELADITHSRGSQSFFPPGPGTSESSSTTDPFPNDAKNYARVGPNGLEVLVNLEGIGSASQGNGFSRSWNDYAFKVVFDVDAASPFTFHRTLGFTNDEVNRPILQADGHPAVPLTLFGDTTGVLEPGHYTFSGETRTSFVSPPAQGGSFTDIQAFNDTRLTVLPEPGALSLLALAALLPLRRRHR
jgi:hypothetical protein